ncbi:MAG: ATP-binding cassette domain-containing protein [Faecousia sp.]
MLELKNITKEYPNGDSVVHALRGVSLCFRKNEFVSVLGPSGGGKTTLLNIIGGLDRYTEGDLLIDGVSTKKYRDRDWDSYRNHSIGFVFQSYNLIPHQSVLANVELALTLSGVSKKERRARTKAVLEQVGLGDQLYKRPNQMSGGQMQRVAIARALINNPSILLADEPTGALDSETSVQIMELLKEVAKDRLVIMVTHNPELANRYSTRIINLLDGSIVGDTMPYEPTEQERSNDLSVPEKSKKVSMSFFTALGLSLNNLMTKKARTILIAFAGSIGIIGIALILSMSNGVQQLIDRMERETLSSYPLTIEKTTMDLSSMMNLHDKALEDDVVRDEEHIYSVNIMTNMMDTMLDGAKTNNLAAFKKYIDSGESGLEALTSDISYSYSTPLTIYRTDGADGIQQVNPNQLFTDLGVGPQQNTASISGQSLGMSMDVWTQMLSNDALLNSQYDVVAGKMPENYNEVVLITDEENRVTDFTLYSLGILDPSELKTAISNAAAGEDPGLDTETRIYSFDEILGTEFKLLVNTDYFAEEDGIWVDKSEDQDYMQSVLDRSESLTIVGIIRPAAGATTASYNGVIGYRSDLMTHLLDKVNNAPIVIQQKADPETDVFSGLPFLAPEAKTSYTAQELADYMETLPEEEQLQLETYIQQMSASGMDEDAIATKIMSAVPAQSSESTYQGNLNRLGVADPDDPDAINLFPIDFESKDLIAQIINSYNADFPEEEQLTYTDFIGLMISSITTIINAVSYILIAFVAVSLVVSSIMIGIITYISVLERTREIGVLRSIGASKRDISRVFNAETLTIGFSAGIIGIGLTLLLILPINALIEHLTGLSGVAVLPVLGAIILIGISMLLTFIAGLIPSRIASKKDPVVALRSE